MLVKLPDDFTLLHLRCSQTEGAAFSRKVLGNLSKGAKHGALTVRFGRTGKGLLPNYRLETAEGAPLQAFDGNNHLPWAEGERFDGAETWSTASMSFEDIQRAILHFGGKRNPSAGTQ